MNESASETDEDEAAVGVQIAEIDVIAKPVANPFGHRQYPTLNTQRLAIWCISGKYASEDQ